MKAKRVMDNMMIERERRMNPVMPKKDPVYRDMQNIVDKAKRGEKL